MTKEETLDWLYRLRSNIGIYMPREWNISMVNAPDMAIKVLEQEPKTMVEIDLYSVIKQKYIEREVLDKIRAEIEKLQKMCDKNDLNLMAQYSAFGMVLDIFDKYKAESER